MSDLSTVMLFEFLPNEILIKCFEYLNAAHIFYSFEGLNFRFNKLLRSIPLYLSFENVRKRIFDQFNAKMLSIPEIQNQIISLKLSDKNTCDQTDVFLSLFSLDKFVNLQFLKLNPVPYDPGIIEKLELMLPLIPKLCSFHSSGCCYDLPIVLLSSKLQTLKLPELYRHVSNFHQTVSIINLIIDRSDLQELFKLFSYTPMLKYLKVREISGYVSSDSTSHCMINLGKIIINSFQGEFQYLKMLVKQTPNLKDLTISSQNKTMINAYDWQDLISTSLPYLNIFKFKFIGPYTDDDNTIFDKFKQFQNHFWQDQHHWNTEYALLDADMACIYTTPFMLHTFRLTPDTKTYSNKIMTNSNTFDKVTNLTLHQQIMKEKCDFYFPNVKSLTLDNDRNTPKYCKNWFLQIEQIQLLKTIINLNNLKELNISSKCKMNLSSILLEILKQSPQLSSLTIEPLGLSTVINDDELCQYLNRMIKKLDIFSKDNLMTEKFDINEQFCQIFSNLEQLYCSMKETNGLVFLLNNLPKLSFLRVMIIPPNFADCCKEIVGKVSNFNVKYYVGHDEYMIGTSVADICIWID